ncbi:DUF6777 domain-containing protein, partial [Streptomyces sp. URMC 123]|uniref:DUF6777 domain-containing protein n=1 Tax=Streptomyces sp. URMC 123 TaxID=3423403 RepID=UPI003F1D7B3D
MALVTIPVLIAAGTVGCSSERRLTPVELRLEPAGVIGEKPFLRDPDADLRGVASTAAGGERAGDARGAYGGTRQRARCDKPLLIEQITDDPAKAKAWSAARGIPEKEIAAHIDGLTPAVLMQDTLVKNHNYQGAGRSRAYDSVLQAGVAVLVDAYARPAVKCNCGNPLREPQRDVDLRRSTYRGERWEGFRGAAVAVIEARPEEKGPLKELPLVDPFEREKAFDRQVGTDGGKDSEVFRWDPPPVPTPPAGGPGAEDGPKRGGSGGSGDAGGTGRGGPDSSGSAEKSGGAQESGASEKGERKGEGDGGGDGESGSAEKGKASEGKGGSGSGDGSSPDSGTRTSPPSSPGGPASPSDPPGEGGGPPPP